MWQMGMYTLSAVGTAIANCFSKKSNAKYIKEPFLQSKKLTENKGELTEEDKKKERDKLLMTLQLMQINFEMNHKKDES